ncbi:MAG: hypothetical protein HQ582_34360 [Planctomycetes bacterium]|nr:hypothetical protein [Planctomycetota bacterium]
MTGRFSLRDFAPTIHLQDVVSYLTKRGWKMERDEERDQIWFQGPEDDAGNPILQYLPASEEYADYPLRVEDLVAALVVIEERRAIDIVSDVVGAAETAVPSRVEMGEAFEATVRTFENGGAMLSSDEVKGVGEMLRALWRNAELEAHQRGALGESADELSRQALLLVARMAKCLPDCGEAKLALWEFFALLLEPTWLEVRWTREELNQFFADAKAADNAAPDELKRWLPRITGLAQRSPNVPRK